MLWPNSRFELLLKWLHVFLVFKADTRILIDPGATHSFIANSYVMHLGREFRRLDIPMIVSTLVGEILRIDVVYPGCMVMVQEHEFPVDLLPLEMYILMWF